MELGAVLEVPGLRVVPICHYQMEYAAWVRLEIERYRPQAIAVELPSTLRDPILTAARRLPYLSVVLYRDEAGQAVYLPIEPTDPLCEAVRSALERKIPLSLIDLDVDDYPRHLEPMPDPYAVYRLGLPRVFRAIEAAGRSRAGDGTLDARREQHMAYWLETLMAQHERVLFVAGMAHVAGVLERLGRSAVRPAARLHRGNVRVYDMHPESAREAMGEMPFVAAVYERWRSGAAPQPLRPEAEETLEPDLSAGLRLLPAPLPQARLVPPAQPADPGPGERAERGLLELLHRLFAEGGSPLKPGLTLRRLSGREPQSPPSPSVPPTHHGVSRSVDASHGDENSTSPAPLPRLKPLPEAKPARESHRILRLVKSPPRSAPGTPEAGASEPPPCFDVHDQLLPPPGGAGHGGKVGLDRQKLLMGLLRAARAGYRKNAREKVQPWQSGNLVRFLRNYALLEGRLLPDFYQLLVGARACVDDNFAYEVWELGSQYPFIDRSGKLERLRVQGDEIWLGMRKLRFRRRLPDRARRPSQWPVKKRHRESRPGEWRQGFRPGGICSYPPEDLVLEDYGHYLKKKAGKLLSEERSRVEPFTTSLRDGLDMRETLRNWHDGQRLWVRENGRIVGDVGAVVVVFEEDKSANRFSWMTTWWGEHAEESDLSFYATEASRQVVGPGIARCQYGGFLMTYPPGRLYDVWADRTYDGAESKPERLLMAAVDYSLEKHVVYVAAKPPRSRLVAWARRMDKKVVYVPIGALSPVTLKKLRVFHVLSNQAVRTVAKEFIW